MIKLQVNRKFIFIKIKNKINIALSTAPYLKNK